MLYILIFVSVEEQSIGASDLIQQDIDINEPVGNLKKLLEPRIQISLDAYDICLQDIQVAVRIYRHIIFFKLFGSFGFPTNLCVLCEASSRPQPLRPGSKDGWHCAAQSTDYHQTRYTSGAQANIAFVRLMKPSTFQACIKTFIQLTRVLHFCPGEEKLNILEIVKPVETVEVVIDPDAAGEETALVEEGQLIAVERSGLTDETSEQVTRWAAALEGYRKEQVRLGIPYGEDEKINYANR